MAKTSIHIKACDTAGSELHNKRERQLSYIRQDLTHLNESYSYTGQSLAAELKRIQQDVKKHTGRKLQKNAIPLKEGVAVISDTTTLSDLKEFCTRCQKEFGLVPLQIHVHRDEGHTAARQWKPNLHAHIVWRMYNEQGRNVRLSNVDCARMQTILAECLGMERGQASSRKHVDALQYKIEAKTSQIEQLTEEVAELSTTKAAKEETINTIKTVGKYVVDAVTGKAKAKENALQERVTKLEVQLPTEREKGRQEGGKQVLQAILSAAHLKLEDLTPENIGKRWRLWFDKAKSLEQEVKQLKKAAEAQKEAAYWAKINFGNERYREGLKGSQTRIKGLEEDVAELIREYAHGDPDVLRHYSTPREERLFMSPKELEQQEAERKKREQEGKKKAPQVTEAPKQERQEEQKRSWGFRR